MDRMHFLQGKRVLITRPRHQAAEFAAALEAVGAEAIPFPVIEIGPVADTTLLDRALQKLACYDWLILTSVNGVDVVWQRFAALGLAGLPVGIPAGSQVAAIGPKTAAALQARGVSPNFVPDEYVAEAILPGLGDVRGRWVLLARADIARPALAEAITAAGGVAHEVTAYHTLPTEPEATGLQALREGVDVVAFTSSSTVTNFLAVVRGVGLDPLDLPHRPIFACIGPITAHTARSAGLPVAVVAETYTIEGLVEALEQAAPAQS